MHHSSSANRIALVAALSLIVLAILFSGIHWSAEQWLAIAEQVEIGAARMVFFCAPLLLLAGSLIAWKSATRLAVALALFALAFGIVNCVAALYRFGAYYTLEGPRWLLLLERSSNAFAVLAIVLLLMQRLRGTLDRARIAACALFAFLLLLHIGAQLPGVLLPRLWVEVPLALLYSASFVFFLYIAWCLAFRQAAPHRPPIDAGPFIALTCPRCQTPQQIPAGHGECATCRLQITISLNEGVCRKCNYPLRGLTGEKCPECGTPIAAAAQAPTVNAATTDHPAAWSFLRYPLQSRCLLPPHCINSPPILQSRLFRASGSCYRRPPALEP